MEPIEWAVVGGLIALATYLSGCGGDDGDKPEFDTGIPVDDATPDAASDAPADIPADVYVGPDGGGPKDKPGFNSNLLKPGCDIADIDVSGSTLVGVCRNALPGENYKKLFTADVSDPKKHCVPTMYPALTNEYDDVDGGNLITYSLVPEQVIRAGAGVYEKDYIVPFSGLSEASSCLSGLSTLSAVDGYEKHMSLLGAFGFPMEDQQEPTMLNPCGVKSVIFDEATGLWAPATVSTEDGEIGILRGYGIASYQPLQLDTVGGHPVFLNGRKPSAIARVLNPLDPGDTDGQYVAVLNSQGYGKDRPNSCTISAIGDDTFGCINASIDTIDITSPVAEGEKPVQVIGLGVEEVVPLSELPVTDDKKYAVVAANGKIMIVNLQSGKVDGEVVDPLIQAEFLRDVAISGYMAYVAMKDSIYIYDFTDPKNPAIYKNPKKPKESTTILVESGIRSIAVDANGIIYVTVPDDVDPSKGNTRVFSINPEEV